MRRKQFFLEHFDAMFWSVATEWLSSFRSYGFMERAENILAMTGSRRDAFEAVMMRENRDKGFVGGFDFTLDAEKEIARFHTRTGRRIIAKRVKDILENEQVANRIPPSPVRASTGRWAKCGHRGYSCKLPTGLSRTAPHRDRRLIAAD